MTDYTKLVKALRSASTVSTAFGKLMADAADAIEALQAQLPKLGKWIDDEFTSKGRCSVCGEEWSWFDNCMETFKYCPNCGAKMEVQDEGSGSM